MRHRQLSNNIGSLGAVPQVPQATQVPQVTQATQVPQATQATQVTQVPQVTQATQVPQVSQHRITCYSCEHSEGVLYHTSSTSPRHYSTTTRARPISCARRRLAG